MKKLKKLESKKMSNLSLGNLQGGVYRSRYEDGSKDQFRSSGDNCCDYRFKPDSGSWGEWGEQDDECRY